MPCGNAETHPCDGKCPARDNVPLAPHGKLCYYSSMIPLPYRISEPPARLQKARLDNIALVPASLLPFKAKYQPLANTLPKGSVLCIPGTKRQQKIMAQVTSFFRHHGRAVITLPIERIAKSLKKPRLTSENLPLAF